MSDAQDRAEQLDDDVTGRDAVSSDEAPIEFPEDQPMGLPFADADITDESMAERASREEPEVWERRTPAHDDRGAADEQLEMIVELPEDNRDR